MSSFLDTYIDRQRPDLILFNGDVVSVDAVWSRHRAIAVKGGRIVALGNDADIRSLAGAKTNVIDLGGKQVIPGIIDLHFHLLRAYQRFREMLDVTPEKAPNCQSVLDMVRERTRVVPKGQWIEGWGLEEERIDRLPTRADLDAVAPDHPVSIGDFSQFYLRCLNSCAIDLAKLDGLNKIPDNCSIDRATGVIRGKMLSYVVDQAMPDFTAAEKSEQLKGAIQWINGIGYTSIAETLLGPGSGHRWRGVSGGSSIPVYCGLAEQGELNARVGMVLCFPNEMTIGDASYDDLKGYLDWMNFPSSFGGEWVRLNACAIHVDGVPMFRNAAIYAEYDTGGSGKLYLRGADDKERAAELARMIRLAHSRRLQIAVHVAGDRGTDAVLDALETAMDEDPWDARHALYHGSLFSPTAAARMKKLNMGTSAMMEIMYLYAHLSEKTVGEKLAGEEWPLRTLLDAGVRVFMVSDCDALNPDWRQGVETAVRRVAKIGGKVCGAHERITRAEALIGFTRAAAEQEGTSAWKGTIEVGKVADLCILGDDLFAVAEDRIHSIPVAMTIVDGRIVFQHG